MHDLEKKSFLLLLIAVSLAFAWILLPFSGAILWGIVLAVVFMPLYRRILRLMRERSTSASLATVSIILLIVVLPVVMVGAALVQQAVAVYRGIEAGNLDLGLFFHKLPEMLPGWAAGLLKYFNLTDLTAVQSRLSTTLAQGAHLIATHAINIGQNTFDLILSFLIVVYLLFFLLRDGEALARRIEDAVPLPADQQHALFLRFTTVIRATVKGSVAVAAVQGALGGFMFWLLGIQAALLWGVVMAFLSLLPAVGAALIWLPVSLYLLVTGAVWQGGALLLFGVLVIGTVDNFLRPILVRGETKMPDYLVLIATLGGIASFGINGLIIGPAIAAMFIAVWDLSSERRAMLPDERRAG